MMLAVSNIMLSLILLPGLVIGLTLHEFAHALSAHWLGDDFPRRQGRLSLNPFRHLSALGTLALFVLHFGWAKPVISNVYNFRRPKLYFLLTSLAGSAMNLLVTLACWALALFTCHDLGRGPMVRALLGLTHFGLVLTALINLIFALVNLLPIPPLDGSKFWTVLIPGMKISGGGKLRRWSFVLVLVLMWSGAIDPMFSAASQTMHAFMPALDSTILEQHLEEGWAASTDNLDEAWRQSEAALKLDPHSGEAHRLRGTVLIQRSLFDQAAVELSQAIALGDTAAEVYDMRARNYEVLQRPEEARSDRVMAIAAYELQAQEQEANGDFAAATFSRERAAEVRGMLAIDTPAPSAQPE